MLHRRYHPHTGPTVGVGRPTEEHVVSHHEKKDVKADKKAGSASKGPKSGATKKK